MVELQSKSKFFAQIQVYTNDRQVVVGVSDDVLRDMFIEFYQARWYSLKKRVEKAQAKNELFHLGPHTFKEHPWGELREDLPSTVPTLFWYFETLDARAWTIPPQYLRDKLEKSIQELWEDVAKEIQLVLEYIQDTQEKLADEQEQIDACRQTSSVLNAMAGVDPIVLNTFGYRAPYKAPPREITVAGLHHHKQIVTPATPFTTVEAPPETACQDVSLELDDDEDDEEDLLASFNYSNTTLQESLQTKVKQEDFVSIRTIWFMLGLPDRGDKQMRYCIGLPGDYDLDNGHIDDSYAPTFLRGEEAKIVKAWNYKLPGIKMRLGMSEGLVQTDDM